MGKGPNVAGMVAGQTKLLNRKLDELTAGQREHISKTDQLLDGQNELIGKTDMMVAAQHVTNEKLDKIAALLEANLNGHKPPPG